MKTQEKIIIGVVIIIFTIITAQIVYSATRPNERDIKNQRIGQIIQSQEFLQKENKEKRAEVLKLEEEIKENSKMWNIINDEKVSLELQLGFTKEK